MSFTAQNALDELEALTQNGQIATEQELRALAAKVSVDAKGSVTVLYGGKLENGASAGDVVKEMGEADPKLRIITNTEAAKFLNDDRFKEAIAATFDVAFDQVNKPLGSETFGFLN